MMKYAELRLFILHSIFCLLLVCGGAYFYLLDDMLRFFIIIFMLMNLLFILLVRNKFKIFDDSLVVYSFRGIGILPYIVEFDDIISFKLLSRHRLLLTTKQKEVTLYIMDANSFYNEMLSNYQKHSRTN